MSVEKVWNGSAWDTVGVAPPAPYVRPTDWMTMPTLTVGQQKVCALVPVWDTDSNFVALSCAGAYTVDWGDGSAPQNFATGVQANHLYDYATVGNLSTRGYRQAIATITPQAGQNLTTVDLQRKHTQTGLPVDAAWRLPWLDIVVVGSFITTLLVTNSSGSNKYASLLEHFEFVGPSSITTGMSFYNCLSLQSVVGTTWTANITNFSFFFYTCTMLRSIPLLDTHSGSNFSSMFSGCSLLESVPTLNTSNGTNFTSMFQGCRRLRSVPPFDLRKGTIFNSTFQNCAALTSIPAFDTSLGTDFSSMCSNCTGISKSPVLDTRAGTNFSTMFQGCSTLISVPIFDTSKGANFSSMFGFCSALQAAPLLNTSAGTNFSSMFSGCSCLQTIPLIDTHLGTAFNSMFNNCTVLTSVPTFNTGAGTNFSSMFSGCANLRIVPALDLTAATSLSGMFPAGGLTSRSLVTGTKITLTYANNCLGPVALNEIYTNLASGVTAQTITVTSNWGITTDNPAIATAKGWTVTGS
jgi:hypothetical protein